MTKQEKILKRALEMAVKKMEWGYCKNERTNCYQLEKYTRKKCRECITSYFIIKAKEELK